MQCNTNETGYNNLKQICRVEKEIEIDKELEKGGEKEKEKGTPAPPLMGNSVMFSSLMRNLTA